MENNRPHSIMAGPIALPYVPNRFTHRRKDCGPLAVFPDLVYAFAFLDRHWNTYAYDVLIGICDYVPSKDHNLWHPLYGTALEVPAGTAFADSVRIYSVVPSSVVTAHRFSDTLIPESYCRSITNAAKLPNLQGLFK